MSNVVEKAREVMGRYKSAVTGVADEIALTVPELFDYWETGKTYIVGDRKRYGDFLYRCLTKHTSQDTWTPDVSPSLWAKVLIPDENVIPEWEQPDSTNPYMKGDKVTYNGKVWESTIDNNVWKPGEYGWIEVVV